MKDLSRRPKEFFDALGGSTSPEVVYSYLLIGQYGPDPREASGLLLTCTDKFLMKAKHFVMLTGEEFTKHSTHPKMTPPANVAVNMEQVVHMVLCLRDSNEAWVTKRVAHEQSTLTSR